MLKNKLIYLLIFAGAIILVFSWFKDGYMLSYAESSLPFYNLQLFFNQTAFAWSEYPGLGNVSLIITASKPTYFFLSMLQQMGISGVILQAGVFAFLLFSAGLGITLLTKELFGKLPMRYLILAILFYWFNPLSLVNVWNRFLLNYIFFYGTLPLLCYFFVKGLKSKNYIWSLYLALITVIYSFSFSYLVFTILLWLIFLLFTLFFILIDTKSKFFYIKFFMLSAGLFGLTNAWWISQLVSLDKTLGFGQGFTDLFSSSGNIGTLDALSKKLGNINDILRLSNGSFIQAKNPFLTLVEPVSKLFSLSFIGVIFYVITKKSRDLFFLCYAGILFLIIFLSKGNNPPLGSIYLFIFERFSVLQIFRNPVEKFSFLLSVVLTPLFVYCLYFLLEKRTKQVQSFFYAIFLLFVILVWGFPFYTGIVFTTNEPPTNDPSIGYRIKIPSYYKQADNWLQEQGNNFRYVGFPFEGEGVTYKWEKGYSGVELSSALFSTPGILFNTSVPFYNKLVPKIQPYLLQQDNFYKLANLLNVKYYFVRNDLDFQERELQNPNSLEKRLDQLSQTNSVKPVTKFGNLSFWENTKWKDFTFYPANNLVYSSDFDILDLNFFDASSSSALVEQKGSANANLISLDIIHPKLLEDKPDYKEYTFNSSTESSDLVLYTNLNLESNQKLLSLPDFVSIDGSFIDPKKAFVENKKITFHIILENGKHLLNVKNFLGENSLVPNKDADAVLANIDSFNPFSDYLISIDYSHSSEIKPKLEIFQNTDKVRDGKPQPRHTQDLESTIHHYEYRFNPNPQASNAQIKIENASGLTISSFFAKQIIEPKPMIVISNKIASKQLPSISYKKINPTKYAVSFSGASSPFLLVFSELFNNKWEAKYSNGEVLKNHTLTNLYANGWLVEKTGNYTIDINFIPQTFFEIGQYISILSLIGCLVTVIYVKVKWKK